MADCCAHCVAAKTCQAWTLDQLNHRCILSSSAATAYPSSTTKGGYALRADPASLCQEKFQNSPGSGAWQDNDLPYGARNETRRFLISFFFFFFFFFFFNPILL